MITIQLRNEQEELLIRLRWQWLNRAIHSIWCWSKRDVADIRAEREQAMLESRMFDVHLFI